MRIRELTPLRNAQLMRGSHLDGHDFLNVVVERGASAAVVSYPTRAMNSPSAFALLQVEDTLTALHKLATNYRRQMPHSTRRSFANLRTPWELCT